MNEQRLLIPAGNKKKKKKKKKDSTELRSEKVWVARPERIERGCRCGRLLFIHIAFQLCAVVPESSSWA